MSILKKQFEKILPPPVNSFMREVNRIVALEEQNQMMIRQSMEKIEKQINMYEKLLKEQSVLSEKILALENNIKKQNDCLEDLKTKEAVLLRKIDFQEQCLVNHNLDVPVEDGNKKQLDYPYKVTVIVPVYNVELYLEECLNSLLNQTLQEIEIICINDGSTDNSYQILCEYACKDKRVVVMTQENKGLSYVRNVGLQAATGEFIYFMDSDDKIALNALEVLYNTAKENNTDIAYFNAQSFFESEELTEKYKGYQTYYNRHGKYQDVYTGKDLYLAFEQNHDYKPAVWIQFYKREFLNRHQMQFYEGIFHEDELFSFIVALQAERVIYVDEVFYNRRIRENSIITMTRSEKHARGYYICFVEMARYCVRNEINDSAAWQRIFSILNSAKRVYNQLSESEKAKIVWRDDNLEKVLFNKLM